MAEQFVYAVARVRSKELSLLNEAVVAQLCAAPSEEDCRRILSEKGWGSPELPAEEMLAQEEEKTWAFIRELVRIHSHGRSELIHYPRIAAVIFIFGNLSELRAVYHVYGQVVEILHYDSRQLLYGGGSRKT